MILDHPDYSEWINLHVLYHGPETLSSPIIAETHLKRQIMGREVVVITGSSFRAHGASHLAEKEVSTDQSP